MFIAPHSLRSMRALFLLAVLLMSVPCAAQYDLFRPLHVGNEWTYTAQRVSQSGTQECPLPALSDHVRVVVQADTTLGGEEARLIGCTRFALDGSVLETGRMAVPVAYGIPVVMISGSTECRSLFSGEAPSPTGGPSTVQIGGTLYVMNSTAGYSSMGQGPGGQGGGRGLQYGDRVGLFERLEWSTGHSQAPSCSRTRHRLAHAIVDGEVFGANPVGGEAPPSFPAALALTATPTPSTGIVTLRLTMATHAEVLIYSSTGRRIYAGSMEGQELTIETRAWAPGVYIARAVVNGQAVTTRIVVAR